MPPAAPTAASWWWSPVYTGAVTAGEPPGRWYGAGAAVLGFADEVDTQDMTALYERFLDPRDPAFGDPSRWDEAATLGHTGRSYLTEEQLYAAALAAEPGADPERRAELRLEAGKKARKNVAFLDATFSVQKSVTVWAWTLASALLGGDGVGVRDDGPAGGGRGVGEQQLDQRRGPRRRRRPGRRRTGEPSRGRCRRRYRRTSAPR